MGSLPSALIWWCVGIAAACVMAVAIVRIRRGIKGVQTAGATPLNAREAGDEADVDGGLALHQLLDRAPHSIRISREIDNLEGLFPPAKARIVRDIFEDCTSVIYPRLAGEIRVIVKYAGTVLHATIDMPDTRALHDPSLFEHASAKARILGGMMTVDSPSPGRMNITMTIPLP